MVNIPTPQGEYAVGTITYTIYNERDEALEEGAKRNVSARLYYPVLIESVEGMSKIKDKPDIESNDAITVTEYAPDR